MNKQEVITDLRVVNQNLQYSKDGGCHWVTLGAIGGSDGADGEDGADGADGNTPEIDPTNNHWCIGGQDTGICARGEDGDSPYINQDGYWVVEGQVTQYKAAGDTYTPAAQAGDYINEVGTPTVTLSRDDTNKIATFVFNYLKGETGDTPALTCEQVFDAYDQPIGYNVLVDGEVLCQLLNGDAGQQGPAGATGPQGPAGDGINWKEDEEACTDKNDGYVDELGDLYVRTSESDEDPEFVYYGNLKGPKGDRGPQGMWFMKNSYETIVGSTDLNFAIEEASIGDFLVYIGESTTVAPQGQVYKFTSYSSNIQHWTDQDFNIKGPKGDKGDATSINDLDLETLVIKLRGYPLYSQGDGIDIVPNEEGYYVIKALIDNTTIKFDSEGRLYATGEGGGSSSDSTTVVTYYNTQSEDSSEGTRISTILNRFFGTSPSMTGELVGDRAIASLGISEAQAKDILRGNIKTVMIKVPGDRSFRDDEDLPMFIPATIINDNYDTPSGSCLLFGLGYKAQSACVVNSANTTVTQEIGTNSALIGLAPVLYCINLVYDDVMEDYRFYGFVVYPSGNFGLFGTADTI